MVRVQLAECVAAPTHSDPGSGPEGLPSLRAHSLQRRNTKPERIKI